MWLHGSCLPRVSLPRERTRFEAASLFLDLVCKVDREGVAKKIGKKPGTGCYRNQKRRLGKMEFRMKELIWMTVKLLQIWDSMILWMSQVPPIWEILWLYCIFGKAGFPMTHWVSPKTVNMNYWQCRILYLGLKVIIGKVKPRTKMRIPGGKQGQPCKWQNVSGIIWSPLLVGLA